ncbi:hypothetical protein HYFRA_00010353 [Hymenoscyphus fraxineus]|uniref:Altered inheritance of mitochondria protein 6 n=1 Tax=Hymenoscyphus fraxineus TaxID=746836 RepID=A0A9N9KYP5_9HELO|nr:hypothetical protein HYFRA_00010353 [Hymenoscyphus fraxineus]
MPSVSSCLLLSAFTLLGVGVGALNLDPALQEILDKAHQAPLYTYPTSLTQGIVPKPIHSHNDYWRDIPFYSALSQGAISIEADVWLYNGTLHIGHEQGALTNERTFDRLYVSPILDVLKRQNPKSRFLPAPTHNGVFDTDAGQTLYLFVDLKTDGASTWPVVIKALEPLREAGFLTRVNNGTLTKGAVTVIGTGNTPLNLVQPVLSRDYFWDGPIATLNTTFSNITASVSPIASASYKSTFGTVTGAKGLNETMLEVLRGQVKVAKEKGILLRYWDQPGWPIGTRNGIWRQLRDEGVDLINVDDLEAAAGTEW